MRAWQVVIPALLVASGASAQQAAKTQGLPSINLQGSNAISTNSAKGGNEVGSGGDSTMADLLSRGYEIKAAVPNGGKFVVFMQKDQSAYACEFSSLTNTRCGSLN
ncbi:MULTISPECIES: hypothetical protein [unclassified Rhizobium]|jgi:hypothetical protein|uniref:hypothetical protein n=1 Tax=unclassified Rhizobium TaxID=2613769 RepID=UPI0006477443|nr:MULTISPECIES: hypothetical protein [unclassified Rhizobium]MBN8953907.1 hypothetical protein [Rhizobium tropici]OJY69362.1 MAG: hypothetical protein BGP09_12110 [Rhizobium sp. 60-20]RKD73735.1 hypothetical protein BJ928_10179 [Rhizobium sp. WW_1]